jgi:hypothetical protein
MFRRKKKSYRGNQPEVRQKIKQRRLKKKWFSVFGRAGSFESAKKSFRPMLVGFFFLLIMGLFIGFAIFSPYFLIKEITIQRDSPFVDGDGIKIILGDIYGTNLLLFDSDQATTTIKESYPEMISVNFIEKWPNTLEIKINMSRPSFTLFNVETADFITVAENGVVLNYNPDVELPIIKFEQYSKPISPRDQVISLEFLNKILATKNFLETEMKLSVKETKYLYLAREVHFNIFPSNAVLWVDLQINPESQLKKLQLASDKIGLYRKQFRHIDLRIPGQLFWEER